MAPPWGEFPCVRGDSSTLSKHHKRLGGGTGGLTISYPVHQIAVVAGAETPYAVRASHPFTGR